MNPEWTWLNDRGTWLFYICLLAFFRYSFFVWGLSTDLSWCLLVIGHSAITFYLFHVKRGSLLGYEGWNGKYDKLTYWEQIDGGRHYSRNRKFLMIVPTMLLFISYHYTSGIQFMTNLVFTAITLTPKLPVFAINSRKMHRRSASNNAFILGFRGFGSDSCFPDSDR